jgi:hypothetical protein
MEVKKLKFVNLLSLDAELNGFYREAQKDAEGNQISPEIKIIGLLNSLPEDISFVVKYRLDKIANVIATEKKVFYSMQEDLAKKYGTEKDGSITIEKDIDGKPNPKFDKFQKDNEELLMEEIEISYKPIPLATLEKVTSSQRYSILYDFIEDNE